MHTADNAGPRLVAFEGTVLPIEPDGGRYLERVLDDVEIQWVRKVTEVPGPVHTPPVFMGKTIAVCE